MAEIIKFEQVGIGRKGIELIHPFTEEILPGSFVIITGANGAGKSTLLKTLVGLIPIGSGKITIGEQSLETISSEKRSQLFAYSNSRKIEEEYIRIIDLVTLGRYPYLKVSAAKIKETELIDFYIKEMGIGPIKNKFLNEISDGELQKASIARALVQDTPVIIMDEPTAFLDYPSKKLLFALLRKLAIEKNKMVICATHDVEMAGLYGTHFWHLGNKSLQFSDKPVDW